MVKGKLSIIIPDRNGQPYLQQTIDHLLENAKGEIEIIVVCDGVWPNPPLNYDKRVIIIHHGTQFNNYGMKEGINRGIAISTGEYILKSDGHCLFGKNFDEILKANCDENWVVIPRRYRLLADENPWKLEEYLIQPEGRIIPDSAFRRVRPPIDYMFLAYPYERPFDKTCGLHGAEDRQRYEERKDILIDDVMTCQGSAYFMPRKHWDKTIEFLDSERFSAFTMEAQEITCKTWLSGGRVVVNKNTWYAHMHKGKRGKRYGFSNAQYDAFMRGNEKGRLAGIDYFLNNKFPKAIHDFEWLLEKFWPVPTWPENWKERLIIDEKTDYSHSEGYNGI